MLDAIFNNRLILGSIVLFLLLLVPFLLMRGHKLRNPAHPDRRKHPRPGSVDRRA